MKVTLLLDPNLVNLIGSLGFPMVFCFLLYFDMRKQLILRLDKIEEKLDNHLEAH